MINLFGEAVCSKGWANRCAHSTGKVCKCACGGKNHGTHASEPAADYPKKFDHPGPVPNFDDSIMGLWEIREVYMNDQRLDPAKSQALKNHSPDGFAWGYIGSGPAQLALAVLLELCGEKKALEYYQMFKVDVIAQLPKDEDFILPMADVRKWIRKRVLNRKNI